MTKHNTAKILTFHNGLLCYLSGNFDSHSIHLVFKQLNRTPLHCQRSLTTIMSDDVLLTPDAIDIYVEKVWTLSANGCGFYLFIGGNPVMAGVIERLEHSLNSSTSMYTEKLPVSCHRAIRIRYQG